MSGPTFVANMEELGALPEFTVVRDAEGVPWLLCHVIRADGDLDVWAQSIASGRRHFTVDVALPATVLTAPSTEAGEFSIDAAHLLRQREFSDVTFGPGARTAGVLDHLRKELLEVEEHPDDLSEWADLIILAFDGATRRGHAPQAILDAVLAKQVRNEARTWPDWRTQPLDKAIEHLRDHDPLARPASAPIRPPEQRCPRCGGLNGSHGLVHRRNEAGGGGGNLPCPNTPAQPKVDRCPKCGHMPHGDDICLNMQSDNECSFCGAP